MNTLSQPNKNIFFFLTAVAFCATWHFCGVEIVQSVWPSISNNHPFDLTAFIQSASFLFVFPVIVGLILSWLFGLWKGVSVKRALVIVVVCLILPSAVNGGFELFSKQRTASVVIGTGR